MSLQMCRLCLGDINLSPIFVNEEQSKRYTTVLALTTGLKIELEDGLPQHICDDCTNLVNSALNLRNQSHLSEIKLIKLGYVRKKTDNNENTINDEENNFLNDDFIENDDNRLPDLKIEVQFDRLTEESGGNSNEAKPSKNIQPKKCEEVKISRKDRTAMYRKLVDGEFDPKGPVKCKICKKTVSKWSCFISHAKLHLGFKFMCEFCGKSFISTTQLKRHCRSYHGLEKELACKHCGYLALDNAQLLVHERRYHTGERPYICDTCGASYFTRRCLIQHIESHRTECNVQCEACPLTFKSRRHLARHRYSAHARQTRARCPVCARNYTRKYLRAHVTKHHPNYNCEFE